MNFVLLYYTYTFSQSTSKNNLKLVQQIIGGNFKIDESINVFLLLQVPDTYSTFFVKFYLEALNFTSGFLSVSLNKYLICLVSC